MEQSVQEKAKELIKKFYFVETPVYNGTYIVMDGIGYNSAKECALIAVNEILEVLYSLKLGNALSEELEYYEQVKNELTKSE